MAAIINVKNVVIAEMIDEELMTYGAVEPVSPLMSIKVDTKTSAETLYGDGSPTEVATVTAETNIEFQINDLPAAIHAKMLGRGFDEATGVLSEHVDDNAPYFALGFELVRSNGKSVRYWYLKGTFEEPAVDAKQKEDKATFSTPTVKGTFIYREDGYKRHVSDEEAGTTPPENFFATVFEPVVSP